MTSNRRRCAAFLLAAGLLGAGAVLWRGAPAERDVIIDLGDPQGLKRVEMTYWPASDPEQRTTVVHSFGAVAPARIQHRGRIPAGDGVFSFRITRELGGVREDTELERRIAVVGSEVVVFTNSAPGRSSR